jgi:hypothetical protein
VSWRGWAWLVLASSVAPSAVASAQTSPVGVEVRVLDEAGVVLDAKRAHASLSRSLPPELGQLPGPDHDALRFLLIGPPDTLLEPLQAQTRDAAGKSLDAIVNLQAAPSTCPDGVAPELVCRQTPALRLVPDALDRNHPAVKARSLQAVLGGSLRLTLGAKQLLELPIGGPRLANGAAIDQLGARLRVLVLRARAGGAPAVGGSDAGARQLLGREVSAAAALWGQCGITLALSERSSIQIVDPPASQLLTVGCGSGQPASGGELRLRSGERNVSLTTHPGESPISVALRLADALGVGRKAPAVFENQRAVGDAVPSADLLLDAGRKWQTSSSAALSSDPTLPLCLGQVDLSDGLSHFGDADAFAGTFEERALLRAFDDGDPRSIEVLVVPEFARGERIGESFIVSAGSSLSNSVIIDRSAIATGARSFALAHELGHVLMAMPGHPDDFGVDQSWSLMDSDVSDPTIFGPRRLSVADCERAVTQTGPNSRTPLLETVKPPARK